MDYKKIFESTFSKVINQKKILAKEIMVKSKQEGRAFDFVYSAIREAFYKEIKELDIKAPYDLKKFHDLLSKGNDFYSTDVVKNMLEYELQNLFTESYKGKSYASLVDQLATRFALRRSLLANQWNYEYSEYLFHYGHYEKYTLQVYKRGISSIQDFIKYEKRNEYQLRSPYGYIPNIKDVEDLEKQLNSEINGSQKVEKIKKNHSNNAESPIPDLNEDEKLLLIHYLIRSTSLDKIEKVKILALLGNSPINLDIFKQESRDNIQYQQVLKGYQYRGIKKAKEILSSLYDQVEVFKIENLNKSIKMDLNAIKNEQIKKSLDKN